MDFMWLGVALVGLALVLIGGLLVHLTSAQRKPGVWHTCICAECIKCGCNESWRHHNSRSEITRLPSRYL